MKQLVMTLNSIWLGHVWSRCKNADGYVFVPSCLAVVSCK